MGNSSQYPNVPEWTLKDTGYHTGDMVKYQDNIFQAAYWAGKEPGVDPGWSLYDELYDLTSPTPATTAKIIGYLPTWRTDLDFGNALMYQNITHGIIAFLNFDQNNLGALDQTSANAVAAIVPQVVTAAHQAGTYISVAVGGAADYGFLNLLTAVGGNASDPRLDTAVQNVAQFVQNNALDGVDLDLECWWDPNGDASKDQGGRAKSDGPHPAGAALVVFAQKLKAALPGKLVSAALFATSWYGNNYDPTLAEYVDWLSIMSYDLTGSWNQSPVGPHTALNKIRNQDQYAAEQQGPWPTSGRGPTGNTTPMQDNPIFSVEDSLWYWSNPFFVNWQGAGQKVARSKLVAGVPLYGYDFAYSKGPDPQSGQIPPGYAVVRYKDVVQQFPGASAAANANIKVAGNTPRPSFVSAPGTYPYAHNIYFETPDTAVTKLKFLEMLALGGVIIWEMSNEVWDDGVSIVKALYNASGNPATRPALPAPSFASGFPTGILGLITGPWSDNVILAEAAEPTAAAEREDAAARVLAEISGTPGVALYNGQVYVLYEGAGQDGTISLRTFDVENKQWSQPANPAFPSKPAGITGPPAVCAFNNGLVCVHESAYKSGELWYFTYSGETGKWSNDTKIDLGRTVAGSTRHNFPTAALAVFQDSLHCVFEGGSSRGGGQLWHMVYTPGLIPGSGQWGPAKRIGTYGTSGGPGLAVVDSTTAAAERGETRRAKKAARSGVLYCLHEGAYQEGHIWFTTTDDGNSWSADTNTNLTTSGPPGVAVATLAVPVPGAPSNYTQRLYMEWEGPHQNHTAYTNNNPTHTPQPIANATIDGPPGLTTWGNTLMAVYATPTGQLNAMAAPIGQPEARTFNLMLPTGRQTAPYPSLPSYTTDLQNSAPYNSSQFPVQMTRHHVIPFNLLFSFWNELVTQGQLGQGPGPADALLTAMAATVSAYLNSLLATDREAIISLLQGMADGTIRHDANAPTHDAIDNLATVYQWLPGNLFVGPSSRSDDPGRAFETGAVGVIGGGNFERYVDADQAIQTYLNAPQSVDAHNAAERAASNLSDIATMTSAFPLNPNNWTLVSGSGKKSKYKLTSTQQLRRVARAIMESAAD